MCFICSGYLVYGHSIYVLVVRLFYENVSNLRYIEKNNYLYKKRVKVMRIFIYSKIVLKELGIRTI